MRVDRFPDGLITAKVTPMKQVLEAVALGASQILIAMGIGAALGEGLALLLKSLMSS